LKLIVGMSIAVAAAFLLYRVTLAGAGVTCEACVSFEGREGCRSAAGPDQISAERAAVMTACALVSSGVTDTIACQGIVPTALTCSER
jgi:hypothetical protein